MQRWKTYLKSILRPSDTIDTTDSTNQGVPKNKYLRLLIQIPNKCFYGYENVIERIKINIKEHKPVSYLDIALCYYSLCSAIANDNKLLYSPKIEKKHEFMDGDYYHFQDYINPNTRLYYDRVYVKDFLLPKLHRIVFVNKEPSKHIVLVKPKQGNSYRDAHSLAWKYCMTAYVRTPDEFKSEYPKLTTTYIENCHLALKRLMECAEFVYNDESNQDKGSVVLAKELNLLLVNQKIVDNMNFEMRILPKKYRPYALDYVVTHKSAMFGELKHDWEHYHENKARLAKIKRDNQLQK